MNQFSNSYLLYSFAKKAGYVSKVSIQDADISRRLQWKPKLTVRGGHSVATRPEREFIFIRRAKKYSLAKPL